MFSWSRESIEAGAPAMSIAAVAFLSLAVWQAVIGHVPPAVFFSFASLFCVAYAACGWYLRRHQLHAEDPWRPRTWRS